MVYFILAIVIIGLLIVLYNTDFDFKEQYYLLRSDYMFDRCSAFCFICLFFDISFVIAVALTLVTNYIKSKMDIKDDDN